MESSAISEGRVDARGIVAVMRHVRGTIRDSVLIDQHTIVDGVIQASVTIRSPATVTLRGKIQGNTSVDPGSKFIILGAQEGSVHVALGGEVVVEQGGKLAGSLHNDGL